MSKFDQNISLYLGEMSAGKCIVCPNDFDMNLQDADAIFPTFDISSRDSENGAESDEHLHKQDNELQ